ncbi:MAG: glycosyltransferase family 39 protein [Phascolarctobacterium sp.]|nr:glycosyltransferase family 39 protein [Phascolarctobacterium sp.]
MDKQFEERSIMIIAVVAILTIFFGIGGVPLLDPDEPVYAETAREMLLEGDLLSPRIFGNYWYDKPPMYYWLVALAQTIFGDNEFAARFPAGLMAFATSMMMYFSVTKLFNERAGFWSSIILTTSVEFFYLGKAAVTDSTLLFFMTASILSFLHKKYWLMYVFMAFATLTKGPIGIVFPGTIIFLYLLFMGQIYKILEMHVIRGMLLYFLIAGPWYYAMYTVHGMEFINTFLGFHNVTRFTTPEHASRVTIWYYFPVLIVGLFPWISLLPQAVYAALSDSRIDDMRNLIFMHIWLGFVFLFFTICQTKLVSYILPMYPPLAIVIGWSISHMITKQRHNTTYTGWAISALAMFILIGVGFIIGGQQLPELELGGMVLGAITIIIGVGIAVFLIMFKDVQLAAGLHAIMGIVIMIVAFGFLLPEVAPRFSMKEMAAYYMENAEQDVPLYVDKFLRPGMMYYAHRHGKEMLPQTGAFAEALRDGSRKYIMVRGLEYRRLQKTNSAKYNLTVVKENSDIFLLEQK